MADLRTRTVRALISGGISCGLPEDAIKVSPGQDLRLPSPPQDSASHRRRSPTLRTRLNAWPEERRCMWSRVPQRPTDRRSKTLDGNQPSSAGNSSRVQHLDQ